MPTLTLEARSACILCGCRLRGFHVGTYRINKGSLVNTGSGGLGWVECPECGPPFSKRNPTGVAPYCDRYHPIPESQAKIDAVRARKGWS